MGRRKKLTQKQIFDNLYKEYSERYFIPLDNIIVLINQALQTIYKSALPIVINEEHNITITEVKNGIYTTRVAVISQAKQKEFSIALDRLIINYKLKQYHQIIRRTLKDSHNMFYGKPVEFDSKKHEVTFQLYDIHKEKITNFYAIVHFKDLCEIEYDLNKLYIVSPKTNFYPVHKNGKFFIHSRANSINILRAILIHIFKNINIDREQKLSFYQIKVTQKNTISIFLNQHFASKQVMEFLSVAMVLKSGFRTVCITKKGGNKNIKKDESKSQITPKPNTTLEQKPTQVQHNFSGLKPLRKQTQIFKSEI